MSSTSTDSGREAEITLYNPSSEEAEELDPSSIDRTMLDLEIDRELAERLLEVSKHLGLNPTIVASRAIDLVCEEIGTLSEDWRKDEEEFGTVTLIQRYQARVDLLQALKEESEEASDQDEAPAKQQTFTGADSESDRGDAQKEEEPLWDAVDEINDVLDEEKEASGEAKEEASPTEEFPVDEVTLAEQAGSTEAESRVKASGGPEKSNRWGVVDRVLGLFSGRDEQASQEGETLDEATTGGGDEASVSTDEIKVNDAVFENDEPENEDHESPPTAEISIDEASIEEDKLEESDSDDTEEADDDIPEADEWDAVETIIQAGEQAKN